MKQTENKLVNLIAQTIYDKKGFNCLTLDVRGVCLMTDYFVIAEGNVDRHVIAIGRSIVEALKEAGHPPLHMEGERAGDWEVIDFGEVVVHLFTPDLREKYSLEEIWKQGKIVDVSIELGKTV